jgi:hypothetical protein
MQFLCRFGGGNRQRTGPNAIRSSPAKVGIGADQFSGSATAQFRKDNSATRNFFGFFPS